MLSAVFERCVFYIFRLIVYNFFLAFYVTSSGFELRLIIFFSLLRLQFFFMFSQFFIFLVCPILSL